MPCLPERERSVSLLLLQFERRKFQKHDYKIDQSIEFSQSTTYWVGELDNCIAAWLISIHLRGRLKSDETAHSAVSSIY